MKQIDEYLNKLYKGLKSSESKESKEEMKIHILEIVNELKQDGKNEQEAIKIALERFGEQDLLNGGLWFLFNNQKKLSRSIFKFGICFLGIAFIAALILVGLDIDHPFFVQFEEKIPTTLFTLFFMMTNTFFTIAGILLVIWLWITFSMKKVDIKKLREEAAIMMSCKASIKANQYLTNDQIFALLEELRTTTNPYTCPHGRPILVHHSTYELEKMFKRVM